MQIAQCPRAGDLVRVRRRRWRVLDVRAHDHCQLLTLAAADGPDAGAKRRILAPFDEIERVDRRVEPRLVSRRHWRRACRFLFATHTPPGALRAGRRARIDLLPHQLEPALAIVGGLGSRVLLADEVGLGKTIQAALVVSELKERGAAERVLIVTPAGLREQWADELARRFGLDAFVVDASHMRRRQAELPVGVNPWATVRVAIASMDYVKRPEILASVLGCRWDVLIVDEAHNVAGNTERHDAIAALGARCPYVLLLTATPHNGDRRAFAALCDIGAHGDPLLVCRHTRRDVSLGVDRRVHLLRVRPSAAERQMHALVEELTRLVRDAPPTDAVRDEARLALTVLNKRALSSAWALQQTVERRLTALAGLDADDASQLWLPTFDEADADRPPELAGLSFGDPARERTLLTRLADAARIAARGERKIAALLRLLRRIREPVIVFTEYRDTLLHLQRAIARPTTILHGGLSRDERSAALAAFAASRHSILLATDAAGEGLNLHDACRLVINLELPWNPMRLEQRIGRVDRIGQRRTVHAFHLVSRDTAELRMLDALNARIARAAADIGSIDPIGIDNENAIAALILGGAAKQDEHPAARSKSDLISIDLKAQAWTEALRLTHTRRFAPTDADEAAARHLDRPWLTFARSRRTRRELASRLVLLFRLVCEDEAGRFFESTLVPLAADWHGAALLNAAASALTLRAGAAAAEWRQHAASVTRRFLDTLLARERAIRLEIADRPIADHRFPSAFQPGLFDRRAERQTAADRAMAAEATDDASRRLRSIERAAHLTTRCELWLVLAP